MATATPVDLDASPLVRAVRYHLPSLLRVLDHHHLVVEVAKSYSPGTGYVTLSLGCEGTDRLLAWRTARDHLVSAGFFVRNVDASRLELTGYYGAKV